MPPGSLGENSDHSWSLCERLSMSPGPLGYPSPSEGPTNPPRPSERASRPLPDLHEDLPTHSSPPRRPPNSSHPFLKSFPAFPGHPVGPPILSLPSLSLLALRKGLLTPPGPPGETPNLSRPTQPLHVPWK